MSTLANHHERAETCLHHAKRFLEAAGHAGVGGKGSAWSTGIDLDARIMHVSTARMYAELAVHEAHHAKGSQEGPTPLQVEASKVADIATHMSQQLAYDICRGALTPELSRAEIQKQFNAWAGLGK